MSHCLTNTSVSHPIMSSKLSLFTTNPTLLHPRLMNTSFSCRRKAIKSMAAQGIDDLGHLERENKQQRQQPKSNKRSAPVAPIGKIDVHSPCTIPIQMFEFPGSKFFLKHVRLLCIIRFVGQVSLSKNNAADDGDNGQGDGRAFRLRW